MPAVMTPGGPLDLSSVLFRNRIIFIGQPVNSQVAQRVISQLVTLAAIDENSDIMVFFPLFIQICIETQVWNLLRLMCVFNFFQIYLNCPGGSTYSVLAIYDCMSWVSCPGNFLSLFVCFILFLSSENFPGYPCFACHACCYRGSGDFSRHCILTLFIVTSWNIPRVTHCVTHEYLKAYADRVLFHLQIKPKVGTVCFGVAASQGALLLAGGEKGMRYAMPNSRVMIHQPQSGCGVWTDFS